VKLLVPQRRWYQFSLRTLLVVITVLCVGPGGYVAYEQQKARQQKGAAEAIQKVGGDYHRDETIPLRSAGMRFLLGDDRFGHVCSVWFFCPSKVTDVDLLHLRHFPHLREVEFGGREIDSRDPGTILVTDRGLDHLAALTTLKQLSLDDTEITDAGLARLAGLTELKFLSLDGTHVTDAGLAHLSGFEKLTGLSVDRTSVTDRGIQKLSDKLPYLPLVFR
jgi:Leucine Rich repeat